MTNSFLNQSFTTGEVADALIIPRQDVSDLIRRTTFRPEGFLGGWARMTFLDVVLLTIVRHHASFMDSREAAKLGIALRPFAKQLAERYGAMGEGTFVELGTATPIAFVQRDGTKLDPDWTVFGFDSMKALAASLEEAAAGPDRSNATGLMIDMAAAFQHAYVALTHKLSTASGEG